MHACMHAFHLSDHQIWNAFRFSHRIRIRIRMYTYFVVILCACACAMPQAKRHVNYNDNDNDNDNDSDNVPSDNLMHLIMLKAESAEYGAACLDGN